jgi:WD40 repeat protein
MAIFNSYVSLPHGPLTWPGGARSLSPSASRIVSGGDDKTVRLWDVEKKSCWLNDSAVFHSFSWGKFDVIYWILLDMFDGE